MNRFVKIALVQLSSVLGDIKINVKKGIKMAESAADNGARIICFPESIFQIQHLQAL